VFTLYSSIFVVVFVGALVIFICDYIFGLPLGMLLVVKANTGIKGMWMGMLIGTAIQVTTPMSCFNLSDVKFEKDNISVEVFDRTIRYLIHC